MTAHSVSGDRGAAGAPVGRLTVLYDARCPLCAFVRDWLVRQRQLVPLDLVPAGTEQARQRLPELDHASTLEEITVVGDGGQVYRGAAAWVVCLWALRKYRPLAHRLGTRAGQRLARGAVLAAARYRDAHRRPHPVDPVVPGPGDGPASRSSAARGCRGGCTVPD
ncbi:DCC1-like thiol-disulfide oxidoreductase family protein [Streptomyces diastatochromogenes]|uniref:thiol-disulfide oxidoreductase DCC family protein n=1 Tax=Streptomyces diastatochromogenes TaxID=42236 RepID=UPI002F262D3A